jgi:hypothetical protein
VIWRVLLALICASSSALAGQTHPLVQLEIDPCVSVSRDEVRRVVSVELGALLSDTSAPPSDHTRVSVTCSESVVALRVDDPLTGKSLTRTIDLGAAIERARARLLALAVVELISASWTELDVNPQPRVPPAGPRASTEAREAALAMVRAQGERSTRSHFRLLVLGGGVNFFSNAGFLGGGGLRLARDHARRIGWMIDVQADHGTASASLGKVSTDVVSVGAGFVFHQPWTRVSLRLGGGLRGGAVRLSGVPAPSPDAHGATFWAPWVGPMALGSVGVVATRRLTLDLTVEGGYVVSPVGGLVNGRREVAVDGAWIGFQLGVGIFL